MLGKKWNILFFKILAESNGPNLALASQSSKQPKPRVYKELVVS